jgi:hypothetical protein
LRLPLAPFSLKTSTQVRCGDLFARVGRGFVRDFSRNDEAGSTKMHSFAPAHCHHVPMYLVVLSNLRRILLEALRWASNTHVLHRLAIEMRSADSKAIVNPTL